MATQRVAPPDEPTPVPAQGTPRRSVTRADVARYAGVSNAVVSYVLNDGPKPVAPATRARVLEAIAVLDYRPNAAARALSRGVADMIGMIVPDSRNPYFAELVHAVDEAAQQHGRVLLVSNSSGHDSSTRDRIAALRSHQLDGLVIADNLSARERAQVAAFGVPLVFINQFSGDAATAAFGVDYQGGARLGVDHLIQHGHQRIAFIGGEPGFDQRELGWQDALSHAGLPLGPRYRGRFSLESGYEAGKLLATDTSRPTAVFVASDQLAMAAMSALHELGLSVPGDVALVAFDGTAESAFAQPPLTTVAQPIDQVATAAVDRLLLGTAGERPQALFPTTLVVRASCGCSFTR